MMNIVTRYVAAMVGAACVVEGYWVYLRKTVLIPAAREFQERRDRLAAGTETTLEEWFRARTNAAGIRSEIASTEREIIVSFLIPGLQADSLSVSVNSVRVTITCDANLIEERGGDGESGGFRREAMRRYELIMPLPAGADSARHRVVREGETFRIIFVRLDDPTLKS